MRSQFADLILLWYEVVGKVLFSTDPNPSINNQEIELLLNKNLQKCPNSSLFLYFKGDYFHLLLIEWKKKVFSLFFVKANTIEMF